MRKRGCIISLYFSADDTQLLEKAVEISEREHVPVQHVLREALKEYIPKHIKGNPQKPLFPSQEPWEIPMVQRRLENLEWLESIVRRNPGTPVLRMIAEFARITGLRRETVMEYLRTLETAKRVKEYGGKLYTLDALPEQ